MRFSFKTTISCSAVSFLAFAACTNVDVATEPRPSQSLQLALERAAKSPTVKVAVSEAVKGIGCVAVRTVDANTEAAVLPRLIVRDLVGALDSIDAPVLSGKPTIGYLHVVTGSLYVADRGAAFTISCLAPMPLRQTTFAMSLTRTQNLGALVGNRLQAQPNPQRRTAGELASQILLTTIRGTPRGTNVLSSANLLIPGLTRFSAFSDNCGLEYNLACSVAHLTGEVHATPGYPVIVDISMLYRDYRIYSLSQLFSFLYYGGPNCANASETWLALNAQMQQVQEDADYMEIATNEVAALTCESQFTDGGNNLCIDLFIMGERAAFLAGDDRTFDPNAPYKASRAQMYINPSTCSVNTVVNTTRTITAGPFGGGTHAPHKLNRVQTSRNDEGKCVVEWDLLNGFCQSMGAPAMVCPSINGKMVFTPDGNGGFTADVNEDKFPSRGAYKWNGSSWDTINERPETIWLDLMSWRRSAQKLQIERDNSLPPVCELE